MPPAPPRVFRQGRSPVGAPRYASRQPGLGPILRIAGTTLDSAGSPLGGCTVHLFRTRDDAEIDQTVSDGSGAYAFLTAQPAETHYAVAYLAGSPDVAGTTVNTLAGGA